MPAGPRPSAAASLRASRRGPVAAPRPRGSATEPVRQGPVKACTPGPYLVPRSLARYRDGSRPRRRRSKWRGVGRAGESFAAARGQVLDQAGRSRRHHQRLSAGRAGTRPSARADPDDRPADLMRERRPAEARTPPGCLRTGDIECAAMPESAARASSREQRPPRTSRAGPPSRTVPGQKERRAGNRQGVTARRPCSGGLHRWPRCPCLPQPYLPAARADRLPPGERVLADPSRSRSPERGGCGPRPARRACARPAPGARHPANAQGQVRGTQPSPGQRQNGGAQVRRNRPGGERPAPQAPPELVRSLEQQHLQHWPPQALRRRFRPLGPDPTTTVNPPPIHWRPRHFPSWHTPPRAAPRRGHGHTFAMTVDTYATSGVRNYPL